MLRRGLIGRDVMIEEHGGSQFDVVFDGQKTT